MTTEGITIMPVDYTGLDVDVRPNGVALVTIRGEDSVNSLGARHHTELVHLWRELGSSDDVTVIVVTGEGKAFSAGGNVDMERALVGDYAASVAIMREARELVTNIVDCDKPIVSAINGAAAGAGLAVALLADISIVGDDVVFTDGHTRIGLAAGDHAALIWPLLCGMAKAKYYLLTSERIDGAAAERIGLVSQSVPRSEVLAEALRIADGLAEGSRNALSWTKRSLNHWLRRALPEFEASVGMELVTMLGPDYAEGLAAFVEKRAPRFNHRPSAKEGE